MKKLFSLLLLAAASLCVQAQVTNYSRWMAFLEDEAFVCQLSVPGAHDACASSFSGVLGSIYKSFAQTQSKSVEEMLPLGVRAFDLRPCVSADKLHINHGIATTSFDFDPVMQQLCNFVDANPSEFCIVIIRHETEGDNGSTAFADMLQKSLTAIADHLVDFRPNLTVGEARGKILFLSRNDYTPPIRGGRIVDLRDNRSDISEMLGGHCYGPESHRCPWWLQDHYEISDTNVKKKAIRDMLSRSAALAGGYSYTWVVNHTSGYSGSTSSAAAYQSNAKACNQHMQQLLASGQYDGPAGIVLMDYAADGDGTGYYGLSLTHQLIDHNFRYVMSRQGDPIVQGSSLFVAPKGSDMMWEGKFLRKEGTSVVGPSRWFQADFDDSAWQTRHFPTASEGNAAPYYSLWNGTNNFIFVRREFYIDHDPETDTFKFYICHDDDFKAYLNGSPIATGTGYRSDYRVVNVSSSRLRYGRNVLAVQVQQKSGGAYFDCGLLLTEPTNPDALKQVLQEECDDLAGQRQTIYNLAGQKVNGKSNKGPYIVGGKVVIF